jgi:ABC-type multidrug transport system fused ATPase/permease subunit
MKLSKQLRLIFKLFDYKDKQKLLLVTLIQILLSLLDLVGVALIGVVGVLAISGIQAKPTTSAVYSILEILNLDSMPFEFQVAYLGFFAVTAFIIKTIASAILTRRTIFYISRKGASLATDLLSAILSKPLNQINKFTHQELIFTTSQAFNTLITGVVGKCIIVIADASLLVVLFIGLVIVDTTMSISVLLVFTILGYAINNLMEKKAVKMGSDLTKLTVENNEKIQEVLNTYRESVVRNTRHFYLKQIQKIKIDLSRFTALQQYIPNLNRYIIESVVIIGALLVASIQFFLYDASKAIGNLAVFLAAATRIAPAVLRIQQSLLTINIGIGSTEQTLTIIEHFSRGESQIITDKTPDFTYSGFSAEVKVNQLCFKYNLDSKFNLENLNLDIGAGKLVAITGSSGAGKTTLVDLLLGVHIPTSGDIYISGLSPLDAFQKWPGATAYVPQDTVIVNGNIWENIALGFDYNPEHEKYVNEALKLSNLEDYVQSLPEGLFTKVGDRGHKLSGGQRQRLGIARALFTKPKLLVLDEATSSLDAQTEADITEAIKSLKGKTTIIMIAHRLSSVRNADQVIFMNNGIIESIGTFEEVRKEVPNFDKQANLMGL